MNKFLKEFKDKGFFYKCTNEVELSNQLNKKKNKKKKKYSLLWV